MITDTNQLPQPAAASPTRSDEIYVGYLPVPPGYRRFLRFAVPITLWILCALSVVWTRSQGDPGTGVWESGQARTFTGTILAHPYPMLLADDAGEGNPGTILLVEIGKQAGGQRATTFDGQRARVSGWILHRDGRTMLELEPGDAAIVADASGTPRSPASPSSRGRITLRGEIIDSKCFLGAMKPGHGKTHKECATLCVKGGIPPMLVTRDAAGQRVYYLLTNRDGGPLDDALWPLIADPVEVTGEWVEWEGMRVLRVGAGDVTRL